ncbi:CerR family C-terminal domain-containing protein [Variovorax sp. PCZ-1]|uniref:CerR family C-terminal domain-containing protein n=1 Tax=Variovorax sp. PCZ-1 TaxID=2835533 RepID=UPI001BD086B7|nr:CerR family C-terminal domain-containing protein [Variovorax sp. PCZ-1]MBS7808658.1 CerR family C-terminal domain-containing protein [Variovorax sp. PCZ-1]
MLQNPSIPTKLEPEHNESRQCLLHAALRCFAEHGFVKTTTRMIADSAKANVAAIRYYFGDKAGIYRAAFIEPMGQPQDDIELFDDPKLTLEQALQGLYSGFIEPLKQGELVQLCTKLHMREMVEPTGLWKEEIDHGIAPYHQALVKVLCRHLQITQEDDDVHRLAICIVAQAVFLYMGREVLQAVRPGLMDSTQALDVMGERLVQYATALVNAEQQRRHMLPPAASAN